MQTKLLLAALLVLAPAAAANAGAIPVRPPDVGASYLPYGNLVGTWSLGDLLEDGKLQGVLRDAAGLPLWSFDATIALDGDIVGVLAPMEYAGNPALALGVLGVMGHALVGPDGSGVFDMVIHQPLPLGHLTNPPIYAVGFVQGELLSDGGIRALALDQGAATSAAPAPGAAGHQPKWVIFDPKGPDFAIVSVAWAGKLAAAAIVQRVDASAPYAQATSPKSDYAQAGHQVPPSASGLAIARWYLVTF